jgi:hypothetical protein
METSSHFIPSTIEVHFKIITQTLTDLHCLRKKNILTLQRRREHYSPARLRILCWLFYCSTVSIFIIICNLISTQLLKRESEMS